MGCCFSNAKTPKQDPNGLKNQQLQLRSPAPKSSANHDLERRSPPPVEEEAVKEVLSETPISRPQVPFLVEERKIQMPIVQPQAEKFESKGLINNQEEVSEVSQLSEICSMSDSFSTTTTATIAEKREDEAASKRSSREASQRLNQSPSNAPRKRPYTIDSASARERRAKSPARRAEPSPEKKSRGSLRSVRGRESGQVMTRKLHVGSAGVRRDPGEDSGRRSRSPSTRAVGGVKQSKLSSDGRNQLKASMEASRQLPAKGVENSRSEKVGDKNDGVGQGAQESLENPHVSLECFIFL